MAAASCLLSEEELMCSVCLGVLTDPVSTPCGHNFCKRCISETWRVSTSCRCPCCNEVFHIKPELKTNVFISAMVSQFRKSQSQSQTQQNLTKNYCPQHQRPLELFCETDHSCVCVLCSVQHESHELVTLREASETKLKELNQMDSEAHSMIRERQQKITEIHQALDLSQKAADAESAEAIEVFTAVSQWVQKGLKDVITEIQEKQTKAKKQAGELICDLELEISHLNKRRTEVKNLSRSEDHLHVLKSFTSIRPAPNKDWTEVRVTPPSYLGTVQNTASILRKAITEHMERLLALEELHKVQKSAVNVTLNPETNHPELTLSEDHKQLWYTGVKKKLPHNSKRITGFQGVLGIDGFSSGRQYFEVQVANNKDWAVGVAKESINRTEDIYSSPTNGFWAIWRFKGALCGVFDPTPVFWTLKSELRFVGVFVDFEEGLVSFYNAETADLIFCFRGCSFKEKLYPYFYTVSGKAPLIITPLTDRQ